ncbi:MAG: FG-GAP repeat protein [Gemmataceae bacterium]|nr:FG-GAP repeat protein [Planctomycetia bacterium]MBX3398484.1 FG-GAP repeat protein [Gemmataceae bacterium]
MFGFTSPKDRSALRAKTKSPLALETLETRETPAVITVDDTYSVEAGRVLVVNAQQGVLSNDFSDSNFQAILVATQLTPARSAIQPAPALPASSLTFNTNGSFTFVAPSDYDQNKFGPIVFSYRANDTTTAQQSGPATVTINIVAPTRSTKLFATGAGPGAGPQVRVYESTTGNERFSFFPYEQTFTGGVRVATGDLNQDGVDDIVTSPAEGGSARVQVFDGATGVQIANFFVFDPNFRGGAEIAIGDIDGALDKNGNRTNELIVGAGLGGGPRVTIYSVAVTANKTLQETVVSDFFAYEQTFRNGVRVAAGNVDGITGADKRDFVITGAGPGGGPAVKVFDGRKTIGVTEPAPNRAFFAFDSSARGGVSVATGQFRGDGKADIIAGSGAAEVFRIFDGRNSAVLRELPLPPTDGSIVPGIGGSGGSGSAGSVNFGGGSGLVTSIGTVGGTGGIRVAATDRNGDGLSDVIVGASSGSLPRVRIFDGNALSELSNYLAYPSNFLGGVFVGGNSI